MSSETSGVKMRELAVTTTFTEQHVAGREIEEQTAVEFGQDRVFLWIAIKSVLEECFLAWAEPSAAPAEAFAAQAGDARNCAARELDRLVLAAYANPLGLKAVARVTQLGINARRTLDACLEALLSPSTQRPADGKMPRPPLKIDWALGGLAEWTHVPSFAFEGSMADGLEKRHSFYTTEKNIRKDITPKQIANIFCTTNGAIELLESAALGSIRKSFKHSEALNEYSQDFLASD